MKFSFFFNAFIFYLFSAWNIPVNRFDKVCLCVYPFLFLKGKTICFLVTAEIREGLFNGTGAAGGSCSSAPVLAVDSCWDSSLWSRGRRGLPAGAVSEEGDGALLGLCQADKKIEKKKRQKVPSGGGLPRGLWGCLLLCLRTFSK